MSKRYIKSSYYSSDITTSEIQDIIEQLENLIEIMDDLGVGSVHLQPNTYNVSCPYIATYNGFLDIRQAIYDVDPENGEELFDY